MLYPSEEQKNAIRKSALLLERHNYNEIKSILESLSAREYTFFWNFFLEDDLLSEIASHKNYLADVIVKECKVVALPEDRKRIILVLAKFGNKDLPDINNELKKEFGPYFKVLDKYIIGKKVISWKEIIKKAREIITGYLNLANLAVESQVQEMIRFYKIFKETNIDKIKQLHEQADEILAKSANLTNLPPTSPSLTNIMPKIIKFFKATNHLQLDIDRLWENSNIEDVIIYITTMNLVFETRLAMAEKNIPLTDLNIAGDHFRKRFREIYYQSNLISYDELEREHQPLELIKSNIVN